MRTVLGVIFVLSVFANTGKSLKCTQCTSFSDTPCTGIPQECPSLSDVCGATLIRNRGSRSTSFYYIRSCVNITECFNSGSVTGLYTDTSSNTTCCLADSCDPSIPSAPELNFTLNGLFCPSYIETIMEPCDIKNVSVCTGYQIRCIKYSTSTTLGSIKSSLFLGGCATVNTCAVGRSYISADGLSMEIKRTCYNNASRLYTPTLFCALPIMLELLRHLFSSYVSL